jgi:hypothetical protein
MTMSVAPRKAINLGGRDARASSIKPKTQNSEMTITPEITFTG